MSGTGGSQHDAILSLLLAGERLTPLDALRLTGCLRLGARIYDLRQEQWLIETEIVRDEETGKHYARYFMPAWVRSGRAGMRGRVELTQPEE